MKETAKNKLITDALNQEELLRRSQKGNNKKQW